jgi:TP901 family phage tail tape measure protein
MTTTVASLAVEIGANITGLTRGLGEAENSISGFSGRISKPLSDVGTKIAGIGQQMSLAFAPLTLAMGGGIKVASDFETTMAEIQARSGLTAGEMERISEFALQMGADTAFSANQAAEGFLQLLTSGQSVEQAMSTLPSVLNAAAAGGVDLGYAADAVTDIMAAFNLDVADAEAVVESLARAAGASSADVGSLTQGFQNVGGVAREMGLTVDQTAAALAILSENGIKGAEAGTALKSMLLNMTRATDATQGAWANLGTSFYDTEGNARALPDVLADIQAGLDPMTAQRQNEVMKDLFGSYGILAGTALTGSTSIDEMQASMAGATGASEVAEARMDTFEGRIETLTGSLETLGITVLTPLIKNVLTPLAEKLTTIVNAVTEWADENPELAGTLVIIAGALAIAGPALFVVGRALKAMSILTGPIGLLVLGIGLIIGLLTNPDVQAALATWKGVFDNLKIIFETLWEKVRVGLQPVVDWIMSEEGLAGVVTWIRETFDPAIAIIRDLLIGLWDAVQPALESFKNGMAAVFGWINDNILKPIKKMIDDIAGALKSLIEGIPGGLGAVGALGGHADELGQHDPGDVIGAFITAVGQEIAPKALGGPVSAGRPYLVGEEGPELFVPGRGGRIVPNGRSGGGVAINAYGQSPYELIQMVQREARNADL